MAAPPLLLRSLPLLRPRLLQHHHYFRRSIKQIAFRTFCSAAEDSEFTLKDSPSIGQYFSSKTAKDHTTYPRSGDPDFGKWKAKEAEILEDIEPTICLAKEILHSSRYMDGECLTPDDEKTVVDKLLLHHPHCEDKIGSGLDSIMVDRHPQFRNSRCLFVVRSDGGWIDFSYQKCLRAYLRHKYPSYAERFIKEHLKRGN